MKTTLDNGIVKVEFTRCHGRVMSICITAPQNNRVTFSLTVNECSEFANILSHFVKDSR